GPGPGPLDPPLVEKQ
uniref:Uncharacterized protein n=1 Tax=Amphimedon queenslandica TaxID=400682 RepID=A0A1X7U8P0_AMPQE